MPVHYTEMLRQMTLEQVVQEEKSEVNSKEENSVEKEPGSESDSKLETKTNEGAKNDEIESTIDKNKTNSKSEKAKKNHEDKIDANKDIFRL